MKKQLLILATTLVLACSASDERVESTRSAQVTFGPSQGVLSVSASDRWKGNSVELLAADAYYNCTTVDEYDLTGSLGARRRRYLPHANDKFLDQLSGLMLDASGTRTNVPPARDPDFDRDWYDTRTYILGPNAPVGIETILSFSGRSSPGLRFAASTPTQLELALDTDVRTAPVNLCMAQELRRHSPGSAANTGLFLPEAEQRQLLEIVRERSQIAMLQYALFASVLAAPTIAPNLNADGTQDRLGYISTWLHDLPNDVRAKMGKDFGSAVQLNAMATEEMATLLARSGSKREPYGRIPRDRAEAFWGEASWYQREMALFFGGDPLAMEAAPDGGAPWKALVATPGAGTTAGTWPSDLIRQSFHQELLQPQPQLLLQMARQKGALKLNLAQGPSCPQIDVASSAHDVYDAVERKLRDEACDAKDNLGNCIAWTMPQNYPDEAYWLLSRFRISKSDATTMATWLREALTYPSCLTDPTLGYQGVLAVGSTIPFESGPGVAQNNDVEPPTIVWNSTTVEVKPHAVFKPRPLGTVGPLYSRMSQLYLADVRDILAPQFFDVGMLGFNGNVFQDWNGSTTAESKRIMGATAAHAAIRRILTAALATAPTEPFIESAARVLPLVSAAAGGLSLSLRGRANDGSVNFLQPDGMYRPTLLLDESTNDTKCDYSATNQGGESCTLYALYDQPDGADLAVNPNAVFVKNDLKRNVSNITYGAFFGSALGSGPLWGGKAIEFTPIPMKYSPSGMFTFVLERKRNSIHYKWEFLGSHVKVNAVPYGFTAAPAYDGQDLAFGGELGTMAARANEPLLRNPVEHAYDGFGWETHWVPPLTAAFIGGDANQPSVDPMLKIAEQSAAEAEDAINTAVTGLLDRQKDLAQVAAAQAKSSQAIKQERDGLCGPNASKAQCEAAALRVSSSIDLTGWYSLPGSASYNCSSDAGELDAGDVVSILLNPAAVVSPRSRVIDCALKAALAGVEATLITMAKPVFDAKALGSSPSFSEYFGGSLAPAFIEQWQSLRALRDKVDVVEKDEETAQSKYGAARVALVVAGASAAEKCTVGVAAGALAGVSTGFTSSSYNAAPLIQAIEACSQALIGMPAITAEKNAEASAAITTFTASLKELTALTSAIQQSSAKIESLSAQAKMGQARAELDADLAKSTSVTSFPLYRNFRDADLWRAKATVESARRYALAARRALEARYVVDLTRLDQKETFVSAPSIWADDIYGYDLSLPSSVGLTLPTDQKDPNAIYKSVIKDYVANLRGFMNGFAASRPSAVAQDDIDVINLSGFAPFGNDKESPGAWQLLCGTNWVSLDAYKGAFGGWNCGTSTTAGPKATRARVGFTLDPWGRLNGAIGNEPYTKRYNTRWTKVALNVVGTGVKDCSLAADPLACYANSTVRYNLTHVTPTWTTDYDGLWREQDVPLGQIEGGKGLAVELFLNPLKDGWNTQFISAVARTEYLFRPVGGAYNLEFEVTPEVMLQRIERMQLLVGTSAWVKQK